jgi:hypothetical protein
MESKSGSTSIDGMGFLGDSLRFFGRLRGCEGCLIFFVGLGSSGITKRLSSVVNFVLHFKHCRHLVLPFSMSLGLSATTFSCWDLHFGHCNILSSLVFVV